MKIQLCIHYPLAWRYSLHFFFFIGPYFNSNWKEWHIFSHTSWDEVLAHASFFCYTKEEEGKKQIQMQMQSHQNQLVENLDVISQDDIATILRSWRILCEDTIKLYCASEVGRILVSLHQSGFGYSEGDPILLLCPVMSDYENSMAYLYGGNYALPNDIPGQRPWPGGNITSPCALGRLINGLGTRAINKTDGTCMTVLYLPDLSTYSAIEFRVRSSDQFRRYGALTATRIGIPEEPPLVHTLLLDKVNGEPHFMLDFSTSQDLFSNAAQSV